MKTLSRDDHPGIQRIRECFANAEDLTHFARRIENSKGYRNRTGHSRNQDLSQMSGVSQLSGLSQLSASRFVCPYWSELDRDSFEERAAILEYDGGFSRVTAEQMASQMINRHWREQ
ncbi:MAG: hypothetical protein HKN18_06970 [Silicimonas sp.]|nr:hypothetical protein [Silicimonas sp.]